MEKESLVCPRCHYTTTAKHNLKRHYLSQDKCKAIFSNVEIANLLKDLTVDRPFKCKYCDKCYKSQDYLKKHTKDKHADEMIKKSPIKRKVDDEFLSVCKKEESGILELFRRMYLGYDNPTVKYIGHQSVSVFNGTEWEDMNAEVVCLKIFNDLSKMLGKNYNTFERGHYLRAFQTSIMLNYPPKDSEDEEYDEDEVSE